MAIPGNLVLGELLIGLSLALQRTTIRVEDPAGWTMVVAFVALILIAIGWVYLNIRNGQPFRIEGSTTLPEDEAIDRIIEGYVHAGWNAVTLSDGRVLFNRTTFPDIIPTLFLGFLSAMLAIVYLLVGRQRQMADLAVIPGADGRTIVEIYGNKTGWGGVRTAAAILRELPKT